MSLLDAFFEEYTIMEKHTAGDGEGGYISGWQEGAVVRVALDNPTQTEKMIAEANKLSVIRNALFPIGTPIERNTYLRLVNDHSVVYRVQSEPVEAPRVANIRVAKADVIRTELAT